MSDEIPQGVPFTLSCYQCDAGDPQSYEQAIREGWTEIGYYPEGLSENFLGLCPDCRRQEEREDAARQGQAQRADEQKGGDTCPT